ncbi:MAG TPA: hypothetical protein VF239_15575, partial [Vicinamibacterales bacterium]
LARSTGMSIPQTTQPDVNPLAGVASSAAEVPAVFRSEHRESLLTRMIEQQTAKVPSNAFLVASFAAMGISLAAELKGYARVSRFVGMWAGPLLTMGVYNKLVKTLGTR